MKILLLCSAAIMAPICSWAQSYSFSVSAAAPAPSYGVDDYYHTCTSNGQQGLCEDIAFPASAGAFSASFTFDAAAADSYGSATGAGKFADFSSSGANIHDLPRYGGKSIYNMPGNFVWAVGSKQNTQPFPFRFFFLGSAGDQEGYGGGINVSIDAALPAIIYNTGQSGSNTIEYTGSDPSGQLSYHYLYSNFNEETGPTKTTETSCGPVSVNKFSSADQTPCGEDGNLLPGAAGATLQSFTLQRPPSSCPGLRDAIIAQYSNPQYVKVFQVPNCLDFTTSAATASYAFSSLSDPSEPKYALLRLAMMVPASYGYGLDAWAQNIAALPDYSAFHLLTSGYRTPLHNHQVSSIKGGRHLMGDAADLQDISRTVAEFNAINQAALMAGASYIEPYSVVCGGAPPCPIHEHADWRSVSGLYTP